MLIVIYIVFGLLKLNNYDGIKELILKLKAKKTLITHYQEKENKEDILIKELRENGYENCEYVVNEKEYIY